MLRTFDEVLHKAKDYGPKKMAVASAGAEDVLKAVEAARKEGLTDSILVGDKKEIIQIAEKMGINPANYEIIDKPDKTETARCAVELVRNKKASILMKGMMGTARLLQAVLDKEIIEKLVIIKQATDLCTTVLNQLIAYEYCRQNDIDKNIESNVQIYRKKRDIMLEALDKYFPAEASWTKPEGGFFVFVTLPEYINTDEIFLEAIEEKVAYVPGGPFFANGKGQNTMRLSFCYPNEKNIEEGIKRLGQVIKKKIKIKNPEVRSEMYKKNVKNF